MPAAQVDKLDVRDLSIRQPYAELIPSTGSGQALRGIKRIEYRSRPTTIIGERLRIDARRLEMRVFDNSLVAD